MYLLIVKLKVGTNNCLVIATKQTVITLSCSEDVAVETPAHYIHTCRDAIRLDNFNALNYECFHVLYYNNILNLC